MVYFHGGMSGPAYDNDGKPYGRHKLMLMAVENPELIHYGVVCDLSALKPEDIPP